MNSMYEQIAVTNQNAQMVLSSLPDLETRWKQYLGIKPDQTEISKTHQSQLGFTRIFQNYLDQDLKLFHLTVTYKTYDDEIASTSRTDTFFKNFYLKAFLPVLMKTHKYHLPKNRPNQPICYAFLDEHESKPDLDHPEVQFSERLHHHAMVAVRPMHYDRMLTLCGTNTIPCVGRYARKVMTTHIRECEAMTTLYASKCLRKYPEFLLFPDRLH